MSAITYEMTAHEAIEKYISKSGGKISQMDIPLLPSRILGITNMLIDMHNDNAPKDENWTKLRTLPPFMIAEILPHIYTIKKLNLGGEIPVLAVYVDDGPEVGTYVLDPVYPDFLTDIIRSLSPSIGIRQIAEVRASLRSKVPCAKRTEDPNLIIVANGIFDYRTKELKPFSPDYVSTRKLATAYKEHPENPMIHNDEDGMDWDVVSWMESLSDNPKIVNLLWRVINAVVRPDNRWDKAICLSGDSGCNGKSTFVKMVCNLCGDDYWESLSVGDCCGKFLPADLATKKLIISNENGVNGYFDVPEKLKSMITGDVMALESKGKDKISACFQGVIIQCLNSYVKFRDRTESLYRRFLMVPFTKRFIGMERKYIKDDYLRRPEVLEYVLWKVLQMPDFDELPEPEACKIELEKYKDANDPLRVFLAEILPELKWQVVPFEFLYELYKKWMERNNPGGKISSKSTFTADVAERINTNRANDCYAAWEPVKSDTKGGYKPLCVPKEDCYKPEPLIAEYGLSDWMNPSAKNSTDVNKICVPSDSKRKGTCRGIKRANA